MFEVDDPNTDDAENEVVVTVTLSEDPERTVVIPITKTNLNGASAADYSGVPASVTFDSGDTEKSFTITAADDSDDDDGETVRLGFDATLPSGVTLGTNTTAAVAIVDDDDPSVSVSFKQDAYSVAESDDPNTDEDAENEVVVTVTLSENPERTVVIPITKTNQGGASAADYSGVPASVTFDSGDTEKSFTFVATPDAVDDDDESVELGFDATLPSGVALGTNTTAVVSIVDDDLPDDVDVSFKASVLQRV